MFPAAWTKISGACGGISLERTPAMGERPNRKPGSDLVHSRLYDGLRATYEPLGTIYEHCIRYLGKDVVQTTISNSLAGKQACETRHYNGTCILFVKDLF